MIVIIADFISFPAMFCLLMKHLICLLAADFLRTNLHVVFVMSESLFLTEPIRTTAAFYS